MDIKTKSTVFLGIVAAVAILVGYYVYQQSTAPLAEENIPPALKISKQRAKASKSSTPPKASSSAPPTTK